MMALAMTMTTPSWLWMAALAQAAAPTVIAFVIDGASGVEEGDDDDVH